MLGAVAGDIIGSVYERLPVKTMEFALFEPGSCFTDDTVLTVATACSILEKRTYAESFRTFGRMYLDAGYGGAFLQWIFDPVSKPYNSWGNGAAMRVSPVGFAFETVEEVLREAGKTAEVSHNHPEGIKGAQATALAVFLARTGASKERIREEISTRFGYDLSRTIDQIRPDYAFDVSCRGTAPEAIIAFLDSTDYEDGVRRAVSLGGDSDTLACIAGGIAQAFYGEVPGPIAREARRRLPEKFLDIIDRFDAAYPPKK
ncbi:MAG: ADP-ribosylglycohydrolase family protein [Syntrophobacteraceae bacterium]|nr:ADP-ribosylglycohydrolase family protein [Syntrophobacteraceae bacterium]